MWSPNPWPSSIHTLNPTSILTLNRSSARETVGRVAAAAVAKKVLQLYSDVEVIGYVKKVRYREGRGEGRVRDQSGLGRR